MQQHGLRNALLGRCRIAKTGAVLVAITAMRSVAQTTVTPGTLVSGAIAAAHQSDAYTLTAQAGDVITIRVCRATGDLWPRVVARDTTGTVLHDATQTTTVDMQYTAPTSGLVRINVSDGFSGAATGTYALYTQVNNRPNGFTAIDAGQTLAAQTVAAGGFSTYSISAKAGDILICRATRSSGTVWPLIRLHDPTGWLVDSASGTVTAELSRTLSNTGGFTILVGDGFDGTYSGAYSLFVQTTNRPGAATDASLGSTVSGSIDGPAVMRTLRIPAVAGDVIFARIARTSGNLWPLMRLYDPNGVLLLEAPKDTPAADLTRAVGIEGNYTLLVGDAYNGTYTGQYNLFTQTLTHPANAPELRDASSIADNISAAGMMKTYTLTMPSSSSSTLALRMSRTSGTIWPMIRLYDAYGNKLAEASNSSSAILTAVVQPSRAYVVVLGDGFNGTFTGAYTLTWNFTVPDVVLALRAAGGLSKLTADDVARLNRVDAAPLAAKIDILDVVAIARSAWGL